jgi:hypothetical protein
VTFPRVALSFIDDHIAISGDSGNTRREKALSSSNHVDNEINDEHDG